MPQDMQAMETARAAAIIVSEYEQRRVMDGTPVPDVAYLSLAQATEYVSRVKPDLTGAASFVAAEAISYYMSAGSFDAAVRLASVTLPKTLNNPSLCSYVTELLEESVRSQRENGNRLPDPFSAPFGPEDLERRRQQGVQDSLGTALAFVIEVETQGIKIFEDTVGQMPVPVEPEVEAFVGPYDDVPDFPVGQTRVHKPKKGVPSIIESQPKTITEYEIRVLEAFISFGMPTTPELARLLDMPVGTVGRVLHSVSHKLGVAGRVEAVEKYLKMKDTE